MFNFNKYAKDYFIHILTFNASSFSYRCSIKLKYNPIFELYLRYAFF